MTKQSAACRAVLYLRLSRDDDNRGESESIQNQRALLREYAARQGFSVIEEYIDDGWSGTSFDRPRFQDMLRDMEQHRFDIVLVKDLSRLGRDYIQTGRYLELVFPTASTLRARIPIWRRFATSSTRCTRATPAARSAARCMLKCRQASSLAILRRMGIRKIQRTKII